MCSQKEEPKYIWWDDGRITEYGATLISHIPSHQNWIDVLFNRVIQLEDTLQKEVLIPKAKTAIIKYLKIHPDSRPSAVTDSLHVEKDFLWNVSLAKAWDELEKQRLIEGKSPIKGRPRLWRVKEP